MRNAVLRSVFSPHPLPMPTAIITTRGTGEQQGPSIAFTTMIRDTLSAVDGGDTYDAVYVSPGRAPE